MLLACIGGDFTGSSDIASTLAKGGMATTQYNGIPERPADSGVEVGVVSLKSRTAPLEEAVSGSLMSVHCEKAGCVTSLERTGLGWRIP
jgi:uncharacterized protein YgbK (DUF1537 family)